MSTDSDKILLGGDEQENQADRRVALAEHARRVPMSPLSLHGKKRRLAMGLVDTPGPGGIYFTPASSARHISERHEVREARRANKK